MATVRRSGIHGVLALLAACTLHPTSAQAERIDIDDPAVLGPLLMRKDLGVSPYQNLFSEVRHADGIYSYIYAIERNPYFGDPCCRSSLVRFSVTGHPLGDTWGAIMSSIAPWLDSDDYDPTRPTGRVASITPVHDGFEVTPGGGGTLTVVYRQSRLRPSSVGLLTYHAFACVSWNHDIGQCVDQRIVTAHYEDFLVPAPEPGTIGLFALGLAFLAAQRRAFCRGRRGP